MRRNAYISITGNEATGYRTCDAADCQAPGKHRAPKSRESLGDFLWFCLDHIREYNRSWNYCRGMSEQDIEAEIRNDTVWRRPTWPLGTNKTGGHFGFQTGGFKDDFGFQEDMQDHARNGAADQHFGTEAMNALRTMDLVPPVNLTQLKARYKELVKRFHPDANGGDNSAEERLKDINDAYTTLKRLLTA